MDFTPWAVEAPQALGELQDMARTWCVARSQEESADLALGR